MTIGNKLGTDGSAIVLLHGYPFDRSMWREQIEFLSATGYRVVAPDLRGFGEMSDKLQEALIKFDESPL